MVSTKRASLFKGDLVWFWVNQFSWSKDHDLTVLANVLMTSVSSSLTPLFGIQGRQVATGLANGGTRDSG